MTAHQQHHSGTTVTVGDVSVSAGCDPGEVLKLLQKACELQRKSVRQVHDLKMKELGYEPAPKAAAAAAPAPASE